MSARSSRFTAHLAGAALLAMTAVALPSAQPRFDHAYKAYGRVLDAHLRDGYVNYEALAADRSALDEAAAAFNAPDTRAISTWPRAAQKAFWINAYNVFTLQAVVDHYPTQRRPFSLHPDSSIRQIQGVWDQLTWKAAGRTVTLDEIKREILLPEFQDPMVHFALNCASVSCPVLRRVPYTAGGLDAQLEEAARAFLAAPRGLETSGGLIRVARLFRRHADDFVDRFADSGPSRGTPTERAILGVVATYGPEDVAAVIRTARVRLAFLPHDWSLNDHR